MLTKEQNDRLTLVGPGTPMGALLRRYWQPVGVASELEQEPVQKIRLLGEDLVLFRSEAGAYGLIGDRCPHRCVSFEYGVPEEKGLRCAYHGWLFDAQGRCLERPYDDTVNPNGTGAERITVKAYPTQELGGLIFAYLGPLPAPLLPRWDLLVRDDIDKAIEIHPLPCNWLQCMDNAADPVHFEHLHGRFGNYQLKKAGKPPAMVSARHLKIEFDLFKYGINKRRLIEGESETSDEWTIGHPLIFPNILAVGSAERASLQFRVPVDDSNTLQFAYRTKPRDAGAAPKPLRVKRTNLFGPDGKIAADNVPAQDMVAWVAQGTICDRRFEHPSASDKGVLMYHRLLNDQIDRVARGEDPMAVIRDPKENEPMIDINRERRRMAAFQVTYENYFDKVSREAADVENS